MGVCADCKVEYPYLQKAHVVAKHKGGSNDASNIVLICPNCHHLRDRADRVAWVRKRWEATPPEERTENQRRVMASMDPDKAARRGRKIAASKTGKPYPKDHCAGGARPISPESIAKRSAAVAARWASKTPEELEAWRERCRSIKRAAAAAQKETV